MEYNNDRGHNSVGDRMCVERSGLKTQMVEGIAGW